MVESKDFRKGIFQLEWEHKKIKMQIDDLNQKARDIQKLNVTKDRQLVSDSLKCCLLWLYKVIGLGPAKLQKVLDLFYPPFFPKDFMTQESLCPVSRDLCILTLRQDRKLQWGGGRNRIALSYSCILSVFIEKEEKSNFTPLSTAATQSALIQGP